jgi:hypothetical protein
MTINYANYPANWLPLANNAADSAWRGDPMSVFAHGGRVGAKPFEIKVPQEHIERMAKGGLAGQAKNVANAGVGGDTMVIHINRDEYNKLCQEWGEPTINPHTGMPQFTPFYKQSWFGPVAGLVGAALMATGVGAPVGAALLGTETAGTTLAGLTGIGALGSTTIGTVAGNAAIGAGLGALTGGAKGALTGGALAGAGAIGASALGNYLGANASNPTNIGTATSTTPYDPSLGGTAASQGEAQAALNTSSPMGDVAAKGSSGMMSGLTNYLTDPNKMAAAAVGMQALLSGGGGGSSSTTTATPTPTSTDPNMIARLNTTPLTRLRLKNPIDYYNYGQNPENVYYAPQQASTQINTSQPTVGAAHGGPLSHYVQGGGTGRSDSIPAKLSDGEYVMDAETVALLGDGSSKAGAQRLDQFRANIRKQKGKALAQGKISPDAESPDHYLTGGRA